MSLLKGLPWLAAAALLASQAEAATVTFDDRAAWNGSVTDVVNRTFDGYTSPGGVAAFNNSAGVTFAGVQFVGMYTPTNYILTIVEANASQPWYQWNSGAIMRGDLESTDRRIVINLAAGAFAFGMDLGTGNVNASDLSVRINGAATYTLTTLNRPTLKFFGVTSDQQINTVEILYGPNIYPILDNFSTATVAGGGGSTPEGETPEAASLLLCATGLVWIARMGRRRMARNPA